MTKHPAPGTTCIQSSNVMKYYRVVLIILVVFMPLTALANNQLLLLYSGNVNGEIEGCG